jgi:hypothetical protein
MSKILRRPVTPWVVAGPRSYLAKAFVTHGRGDGGARLVGAEFDAWLSASIRGWLRWRRGVEDKRELSEVMRMAYLKGETGPGWVAWEDGG